MQLLSSPAGVRGREVAMCEMHDARCTMPALQTTWPLVMRVGRVRHRDNRETRPERGCWSQLPGSVQASRIRRGQARGVNPVNPSISQSTARSHPPLDHPALPPIGPSTVHPHSAGSLCALYRPFLIHQPPVIHRLAWETDSRRALNSTVHAVWIPHFVGSPNLPSVAGRLQAAAAVAQEGPISISVPASALPSQLPSALDVSSVGLLRRQPFAVLSLDSRLLTAQSALAGTARVNGAINIVFSVHPHQESGWPLSARPRPTAHAIVD